MRSQRSVATHGAHTSPSTKPKIVCRTSKKDVLNTAMGECDRKLLIKGTPKGVSFLCMAFLLLENLMSGDVEDRNARAMTDLLY